MIKYLIKNPNKWRELELYRFIHAFNYSFDALVFEYLNNPTSNLSYISLSTGFKERKDFYTIKR